MSSPFKSACLLCALIGAALPALAGDGGRDHDDRRGHDHASGQDRDVDVPGWRLPARRVLPPVGYTARPLPGDEPVYGEYRSRSSRWVRGVRYSDARHAPTHVVRDYRGHGLRPPPRGYYWRGDGRGTYLLVSIATGIVEAVVDYGR